MLHVFTTLTPAYRISPELQLSLRLLRKVLPADAVLHEVPREPEQSPGAVLDGALREWLEAPPETPEFVLIIRDPWIFLGCESVELMRGILNRHSDLDCLLPSDDKGRLPDHVPAYFTLRQFENFTRELAAGPETLRPYDGREPFVLLVRGSVLAQTEPGDVLELPAQLGPERCMIGMNAFAHRTVDYYGEDRSDVLDMLPAEVESLLDVGCASGNFGKLLKSRRDCRIVGIELNPTAASQARSHLDAVLEQDALEVAPGERFDCVTCLDSMEHFTDPERLLARIHVDFLKPGGYCLISIPNVGHWSIVEDLLAGRWDYVPIGLMCNTHVRFFTLHSLRGLFHDHGFEIVHESTLHVPLPDDLKASFELLAERGMEIDFANLDAHNYYLLARLRA